MPLNTPENARAVDQRMKVDVQRELTGSNPFLKNSWLGAIITALANRVYDFYLQLNEASRQAIPDTATGSTLERWAAIWGRIRLAASASSGNIVATGTATTVIPNGTAYAASDGQIYISTAGATIQGRSISISSLTRSGGTATATTASAHGLANNVPVTIAGAVEPEYNVTDAAITVTGLNTFTYAVSGTPASPASGTITASGVFAPVPVTSDGFGAETGQVLNAVLTLQAPIAGADNDARVDAGELGGGADQETDEALRIRMLERIQNPVAHFSTADIESKAKEIAGVTRVFVQPITPAIGQVTVYFMRDNDTVSIPSASEVTAVKNKILEIKPANTSDSDVIVAAPTGVNIGFTFTSLAPNTASMQAAITAALGQFFDENTSVGVDVTEDKYRAAISNTVDPVTGDTVSNFTISTPVGDVAIASGEIGVLAYVTFP